jgi:hypothetical protein
MPQRQFINMELQPWWDRVKHEYHVVKREYRETKAKLHAYPDRVKDWWRAKDGPEFPEP